MKSEKSTSQKINERPNVLNFFFKRIEEFLWLKLLAFETIVFLEKCSKVFGWKYWIPCLSPKNMQNFSYVFLKFTCLVRLNGFYFTCFFFLTIFCFIIPITSTVEYLTIWIYFFVAVSIFIHVKINELLEYGSRRCS